jgi:tetratricopeptide (TPR) repeat protein
LLTIPEIVLFYVWNFIFPWHIASQYLWTIKHYSTARVLIPTIVDLLLIAFIADRSLELKKRAGEDGFRMFVFFAIWTGIGLIPYLQIVSIDGTVNDAWFVVSMIGVIGMLGAYLTAYQVKMQYILIAGTALVLVFGVRSALRASDWKNSYILAQADVPVAASDYTGWSSLAVYYSNQHHYALAAAKYKQALQIQPYYLADYNLGVDESLAGQFALAEGAYAKATKLSPPKEAYEKIDENACLTASFTGTKYEDVAVCQLALNRFPKDPTLWIYLAFVEQRFGDNSVAKNYLATAQKYGVVPKIWVTEITKDEPITINFLFSGEDKTIYPQSV